VRLIVHNLVLLLLVEKRSRDSVDYSPAHEQSTTEEQQHEIAEKQEEQQEDMNPRFGLIDDGYYRIKVHV
jgi:hypothetical protein